MSFWRGRRVLVTGHTGFKGSWLSLWLETMGAELCGFALPAEPGSMFGALAPWAELEHHEGDLREAEAIAGAMTAFQPETVIHLAAQALVRRGYAEPTMTFSTNVLGTVNLLEAVRRCPSVKAVVVVTSDKVYRNDGGGPFDEASRLGGLDPYSCSKACAELVTECYRHAFLPTTAIATVRAGNVIGGGDWAEDRLIPDAVRAFLAGEPIILRSPAATRPWQFVLDPLAGYLAVARALLEHPGTAPRAVNFGPAADAPPLTVADLVALMAAMFDGAPGWRADPRRQPPEAAALSLDSRLAAAALDWRPRLDLRAAVRWTAAWYQAWSAGEDMRAFSRRQLDDFGALAG